MDSYYILVPVTTNPEDWIHVIQENLSLEKSKEFQEFIMGRITEVNLGENIEELDDEGNPVIVKHGKVIYGNSLQKKIINRYAICEIDLELMWEYGDYIAESSELNNCLLLSRLEMLQYLKDNEEVI